MVSPMIVAEVRRLLAEGAISQRKIAQLTGVSRGTVGAIASGRRPDYETLRQTQDNGREEPAGPPERCPGCGGLVYMPCLLCRAMKERVERPRSAPRDRTAQPPEPLVLSLRPEHHRRYEQVRAWRREQGVVEGESPAPTMRLAVAGTAAYAAARQSADVPSAVRQ